MIPVLIIAAVVIAAVAWVRLRYLVAVVEGPSMLPTYREGDRLIARRGRRLSRGDVVVFTNPSPGTSRLPLLVKRVVAVPGDDDGTGAAVPDGHVSVRGDNLAQSLDSRRLGCIPERLVVGVVLRRIGDQRSRSWT